MASETVRFLFDDLGSAADGLLTVLTDARTTEAKYTFGGLSAPQVLKSGLILTGDITAVAEKLDSVPGADRL